MIVADDSGPARMDVTGVMFDLILTARSLTRAKGSSAARALAADQFVIR
jgi:hypothetical protein